MARIDLLNKGDRLPALTLPEALGGMVRFGDFHGRRNLVLFLSHAAGCVPCATLLRELNENLALLQNEDAEVLAVVPGPSILAAKLKERLAISFPLLIAAEEPTCGQVSILVADRFGEIFFVARADEADQLPGGAQLAEELAFIQLQCPE